MMGDKNWILQSIQDGYIFTVTDGSYMNKDFPDICMAAFLLECQHGCGRIVGSFVAQSSASCVYRGELLRLMAIHLILLTANKVSQDLQGQVIIISDCLGALDRVAHLPKDCVPTRCGAQLSVSLFWHHLLPCEGPSRR